jgi:hypothetical protein
MEEEIFEPEPIDPDTVRKLPWAIDVFAYPTNAWGLTLLGVFVFGPALLGLVGFLLWKFLESLELGYFVMAVAWPAGLLLAIMRGILSAYMFWYFGVCIRKSAKGFVRTPSVLNMSGDDDLSDMVIEMLQMLCSIAMCLGPAFVYWGLTERVDFIFWSALSLGIFFLPMALLGVVMFDSLGGLNPVLIIVSIFSSFYEYLGVVAAFYVPVGLITITFVFGAYRAGAVGGLLLQFVTVYLLLVAAHILGRFFWRNEEKLYWEV